MKLTMRFDFNENAHYQWGVFLFESNVHDFIHSLVLTQELYDLQFNEVLSMRWQRKKKTRVNIAWNDFENSRFMTHGWQDKK